VAQERSAALKEALPARPSDQVVEGEEVAVVIIGVDPHKASNTIAVLDADETLLAHRRFPNTHVGLAAMLKVASQWPDRRWAVEGANGLGRSVAQRLVTVGEAVVDVPAKLAARVRVYSSGHGRKTDRDDAIATAKAALHSDRPRRVTLDDERVALQLLVDRRHELVAARTQAACRLHRLLRELIPGGAPTDLTADQAASLLRKVHVEDPAGIMRRQLAKEHIADIRVLDRRLDEFAARIETALTSTGTTLTSIYGVGVLNASTSPRPATSTGSPPGITSPATPVSPRSRCPAATSTGIDSTGPGTDVSTTRCTSPR
jgi:transposase